MPRRLNVRGRRSVAPASVWRRASEGGAAGRVGARREQLDELVLLVGPMRLERQLVGVERALDLERRPGRAAVGRRPVELGQRDVLFVDGHARFLERMCGATGLAGLHRDDYPRSVPRNGTDGPVVLAIRIEKWCAHGTWPARAPSRRASGWMTWTATTRTR